MKTANLPNNIAIEKVVDAYGRVDGPKKKSTLRYHMESLVRNDCSPPFPVDKFPVTTTHQLIDYYNEYRNDLPDTIQQSIFNDLQIALDKIGAAETPEELQKVWERFSQYQGTPAFIQARNFKAKEIENGK